jgi:hypothetical protein
MNYKFSSDSIDDLSSQLRRHINSGVQHQITKHLDSIVAPLPPMISALKSGLVNVSETRDRIIPEIRTLAALLWPSFVENNLLGISAFGRDHSWYV